VLPAPSVEMTLALVAMPIAPRSPMIAPDVSLRLTCVEPEPPTLLRLRCALIV